MSTLKADAVTAVTTNTNLTLSGNGTGKVAVTPALLANATTASSSASTGALIVAGGAGVAADLSVGDDLRLISDSAVLNFGADSEITLTHVADTGLNLKHTATADDKPIVLTLQTGETDMAADDVIGTINFQAPDEGTGTDAILVAAGIEAVSEGDFSSSSNATKLSFKTASSAAAAETMFLGSTGNLQVSSEVSAESFNLPITLNGTDGSSTDAGDNIVLDASAASTDVGERLLYEGIPTTIPDNSITLAMLQQGGTDGQVLTSTGATSAPAFEDAAAGGAYTSIANTAITATTNIDFTGFDSSTYDNYEIWVSNARPGDNNNILGLQTSTDGGTSYDASTSYKWRLIKGAQASSTPVVSGGPNEAYISLNAGIIGNDTNENLSLRISIYNPEEAQYTAFTWFTVGSDGGGLIHSTSGVGERKSAADVDAIRFHWVAGDFIAQGKIQFLGIAH